MYMKKKLYAMLAAAAFATAGSASASVVSAGGELIYPIGSTL
jgi:hypothetical protein